MQQYPSVLTDEEHHKYMSVSLDFKTSHLCRRSARPTEHVFVDVIVKKVAGFLVAVASICGQRQPDDTVKKSDHAGVWKCASYCPNC
jgi:hypothetical protein